jgi:glycosyltransferase involved in cell wall biosynthesis
MVTQPSAARLACVERAVAAYARQSYPHRELLVVIDAGEEADRVRLEEFLASRERSDLRVVRAPDPPGNLGRLRNLAIEQARGELVCVWDDDDHHHPTRVERQVEALQREGAIATFLTDVLHLSMGDRRLHWTTYKKTPQKCVPGAGLFRRSVAARYPEQGPNSQRAEDDVFCSQLFREGPVHFVEDSPHLYIYVSHGHNVSGDEFHRMIASSLGLSRGRIERSQQLVREALDTAEHGLEEITVMGNNGPAFTWRREG